MTPFLNIMYEFYARDTSRKIRSVFKAKGMSGTVIYGYLWDEKRENWLVDEEAAAVVRRIFAMTLEGYGPYQIATRLSADKIDHLARYGEGVNKNKAVKGPYGWGSSVVVHILKKREYLGHTVNFKTQKHFKDKKSHYVDESEWTIFENTHEAIIDQETFDNVQRIRSNVKRYSDGWGEAAPLTGLLHCADCGGKMYVQRVNNGKRIPYYTCAQYSKVPVGSLCSSGHRIRESVVLDLISDMLRAIADYARENRAEFIRTVQEAQAQQQDSDIKKKKRRMAVAQKRAGELERLVYHVYSMDCTPAIENHAMFLVLSPEEVLIREIDEAAAELTLLHLAEAMARLSPIQARRLHARYALKKKFREIAATEGVSGSCATESVTSTIKKLQKFFIKNGWMPKEA